MVRHAGSADLPLHGGRVPAWLGQRMTRLGAVIVEAVVQEYGRDELMRRLAHPFWFQSFGAVMSMDWHSSGITTSVVGALKRGLAPLSRELGLHVCGGRGRHSRRALAPPAVGRRGSRDRCRGGQRLHRPQHLGELRVLAAVSLSNIGRVRLPAAVTRISGEPAHGDRSKFSPSLFFGAGTAVAPEDGSEWSRRCCGERKPSLRGPQPGAATPRGVKSLKPQGVLTALGLTQRFFCSRGISDRGSSDEAPTGREACRPRRPAR